MRTVLGIIPTRGPSVRSGLRWSGCTAARAPGSCSRPGWGGERSLRTGRLRGIVGEGTRYFTIGNDGLPRPSWLGAQLLHRCRPFPAQRIIAASDAVPFVEEGRSLFSRFVKGGDSSLIPGSSALVVDDSDRLLAVGRLVLAPPEMGRIARAVAVRIVAHRHRPEGEPEPEEHAADVVAPPGPGELKPTGGLSSPHGTGCSGDRGHANLSIASPRQRGRDATPISRRR